MVRKKRKGLKVGAGIVYKRIPTVETEFVGGGILRRVILGFSM
jgi:hypothetical protein